MEFQDKCCIQNADNTELFCRYWKPEGDSPRALVFIAHGYGEHSAPYEQLAECLTRKGFFVFAHDHVGHGQSKGERALVSSLEVYVRDIFQHVDQVKTTYPTLPIFMIGHSMGGLIALNCGLKRPADIKGMALISPALEVSPELITPCKRIMTNIVGRVFKNMAVSQLDPKLVSRDPEVVKAYEEDPLVYHGGLKAGQALVLLSAMDELAGRMDDITWPFLIQHGSEDGLTEISGSRKLNDKAAAYDKTLTIVKNGYHQLHKEPNGVGDRCINEIADWIQERL